MPPPSRRSRGRSSPRWPEDRGSGGEGTGLRVDLHGLTPEGAMRRLERELHAARVRGAVEIEVITGAGHGNQRGEPVLRTRVEAWLGSSEARRLGVRAFQRARHGGSLRVRLKGRTSGDGP